MRYNTSISKKCKIGNGDESTHNDPSANKNISASFFFVFKLKSFSSHTGSSMMTKSSKMLNPAAAYTNACEFVHVPWIEWSQIDRTGTH